MDVFRVMCGLECAGHCFAGGSQDALRNLEMPRFTRRYPAVLNTLMKQMLLLVHVSAGAH
jgi:hypothetical protein